MLRNPDNFVENINENIFKNGDRAWISWRNKAIRDSHGRVLGNLAIGQDITRLKRSEDALRESEQRFRFELEIRVEQRTAEIKQQAELLNLTHDAIIVRDEGGAVIFWSNGARELYGWDSEEATGQNTDSLLQTQYPMPIQEIMEKVQRESRWEGELVQTCKNGRQIVVLSRWALRLNNSTRILEIMEINGNITARKEADEQLLHKSMELEEMNTALKVLVDHYKNDQRELEERIVSNIKVRIIPYLDKLKQTRLDIGQQALVEIIERSFRDISSPFLKLVTKEYFRFTPKEIEIICLIKEGKTTKEIAKILCLGKRTIDSYRDNIRIKLGVAKQKLNLQTYLLSIDNT